MNPLGLYVHIPFCVKKCGYCDFYSVCDLTLADAYTDELVRRIERLGNRFDTLYFGGGTPSLLGGERLCRLIAAARPKLTDDCEITVEVNPGDDLAALLPRLAEAGVNRLSIGMQSHCDSVLAALTRRHSARDVDLAVGLAQKSGITDISLDVMLGVERQTPQTLRETLEFCTNCGATHISAYMLKIEPNTPFSAQSDRMCLPDEDATADMYLQVCSALGAAGFEHYEISNFAREGFRSRHNMKYWRCEPYVGLGPAAHSFDGKRRTCFPRSLTAFLDGGGEELEGDGGSLEEYAMLRLRLSDGLERKAALERFPTCERDIAEIFAKAAPLAKNGLVTVTGERVALTERGFLLSTPVTAGLLY